MLNSFRIGKDKAGEMLNLADKQNYDQLAQVAQAKAGLTQQQAQWAVKIAEKENDRATGAGDKYMHFDQTMAGQKIKKFM